MCASVTAAAGVQVRVCGCVGACMWVRLCGCGYGCECTRPLRAPGAPGVHAPGFCTCVRRNLGSWIRRAGHRACAPSSDPAQRPLLAWARFAVRVAGACFALAPAACVPLCAREDGELVARTGFSHNPCGPQHQSYNHGRSNNHDHFNNLTLSRSFRSSLSRARTKKRRQGEVLVYQYIKQFRCLIFKE